jgi:hypothetical protein
VTHDSRHWGDGRRLHLYADVRGHRTAGLAYFNRPHSRDYFCAYHDVHRAGGNVRSRDARRVDAVDPMIF